MQIYFLGSGTMFCAVEKNFNSNFIIQSASGKQMLVDCGMDVRHSMPPAGVAPEDIDCVYISHFHSDHTGGLEWLALYRKYVTAQQPKPAIIAHPSMISDLWQRVLSGGLMTLGEEKASLDSFFEVYPLKDPDHFSWEGIDFEMVSTIHVCDQGIPMPCYGLFFENGQHSVFFTADTQFSPEAMMPYFTKADTIFHECETGPFPSGVHSHYLDLCTLPAEIKQKMWLYHYSSYHVPKAKEDGFAGMVQLRQKFHFA